MKQELKHFLETEARKNEQEIHTREFGLKMAKCLFIICLVALFAAVIALISI